jgi:hypothetical protein
VQLRDAQPPQFLRLSRNFVRKYANTPLNGNAGCDFIKCLPPLGSSDHDIVSFTIALSLPVIDNDENTYFRPNFSRADLNSLSLYLSAVNWTCEFSSCATATDI